MFNLCCNKLNPSPNVVLISSTKHTIAQQPGSFCLSLSLISQLGFAFFFSLTPSFQFPFRKPGKRVQMGKSKGNSGRAFARLPFGRRNSRERFNFKSGKRDWNHSRVHSTSTRKRNKKSFIFRAKLLSKATGVALSRQIQLIPFHCPQSFHFLSDEKFDTVCGYFETRY